MIAPIKTYVQVTGMSCGSCRRHVEDAIASVAEVDRVRVDLGSGIATVSSFSPVQVEDVIAAVRDAGYGAAILDDCLPEDQAEDSSCPSHDSHAGSTTR